MNSKFEAVKAFREIEGHEYSRGSLLRAIGGLRGKYLWQLGLEVDIDDLFRYAFNRGWIHRLADQKWSVEVSPKT